MHLCKIFASRISICPFPICVVITQDEPFYGLQNKYSEMGVILPKPVAIAYFLGGILYFTIFI